MNFVKNLLISSIKYIPGWRTKRKIVVFESDDWGSIRMPSKSTYQALIKEGVPLNDCRYNKFDSLANDEDLASLFEVLTSFKDHKGSPAKFTPLSLTANPDFEKIEAAKFQEYHYEELPETLRKYGPNHQKAFKLWQEGINQGFFQPQFHGREHLNVYLWMNALREGSPEARLGFQYKTFGLPVESYTGRKNNFMAAFDYNSEEEFKTMPPIIREGAHLFKKIFSYKPFAFQAPCGIWSARLEADLKNSGLTVIQTGVAQYEPMISENPNKFRKNIRYLGMKSKNGLVFTIRNCRFEPSVLGSRDWVDLCLSDIKKAFYWNKPAIISSHRVNFIGAIEPENRKKGLKQLKALLREITKKWPEVEFMTSGELGKLIIKEK